MKILFIPGNHGGDPTVDYWFPYLKREFEARGHTVIASKFPDSFLARESHWLPHIASLGADEGTVLVGHSSGAIAAMRYAETHRIKGSVLVSVYHTDLGDAEEKLSDYFSRPWDFEAIRRNQDFIIQFNSTDDGFIPIEEARYVHEQLATDYTEFADRGHFFQDTFPEVVENLNARLA